MEKIENFLFLHSRTGNQKDIRRKKSLKIILNKILRVKIGVNFL